MLQIEKLNITTPPIEEQYKFPHVLLVVDQFPRILGGGERVALRLAQHLPQYGFRASILTFSADRDCVELAEVQAPVYLLPLHRTYGSSAFSAALLFKKFLKMQGVRLVHTFFESSDIWAGCVTKAMTDAKLIWSRRDMGILRSRKHMFAYRLLAGLPDRVFAVSEGVRQYCIQHDRIRPEHVQTIFNGIDLSKWQCASRERKEQKPRIVAAVGNIRHVKGHDLLVQAARVVTARFPDVHFSIAGSVLEAEYMEGLQRMVSEYGISDRFQFCGAVSDIRAHLDDASVFVLPSRSEGFSNALVEAMAAGLPVVATDVGGNAEAVENGASGLIVPSEDVSALIEAITIILENPSRAQAMGEAGREIAAQKFSMEAMVSQTAAAYREVL